MLFPFLVSASLANPPTWTEAEKMPVFESARYTRAEAPGATEHRDAPALPRVVAMDRDEPFPEAERLSTVISPDGTRTAACVPTDSTDADYRCTWKVWNIGEPDAPVELAKVPWKVRPQLVFVGEDIAYAVDRGVQIGDRRVPVPHGVRNLAVLDGRVIVGTATGKMVVIEAGEIASSRHVIDGPIHSMATDGKRVVVGGGQLVRVIDGPSISSHVAPSLVWGVAIEGDRVAAVHTDGIVVWEGEGEEPRKITGHFGSLVSMVDGVIHTRTSAGERLAISVADGEPLLRPILERALPDGLPARYINDWAWNLDKTRMAIIVRRTKLVVLEGDLVQHAFAGDLYDLADGWGVETRVFWVGDTVWVLSDQGAFRSWGPDGQVVHSGSALHENHSLPAPTWHLDGETLTAQIGPWVRQVDTTDGSVSDRGVACTVGGLKIVALEPGERNPAVEKCMWRGYLGMHDSILDADRGHLILPDGRKIGKRWYWGRFSSDGDVLIARHDIGLQSVDARTGERRAAWAKTGSRINWDPYEERALARVGDDATWIDVHTGERTTAVKRMDRRPVLAVDPLGHWFLTGHDDSSVRRWSPEGELLEVWKAGGVPTSMGITADGRIILGTKDGAVTAWRPGGSHEDLQLPRANPLHYGDDSTAVLSVLPVGGRFGVHTKDDRVFTFGAGGVRPEGRWKVPPGTTAQDIFEALGAPDAEIDALVVDDEVVLLGGGETARIGMPGAHALPFGDSGALVSMEDGAVHVYDGSGVLMSITWMWEDGSWATWRDGDLSGAGSGFGLVRWP